MGCVCMDQMMVDVTVVPDVEYESEGVFIGKGGNEAIMKDDLGTCLEPLGTRLYAGRESMYSSCVSAYSPQSLTSEAS